MESTLRLFKALPVSTHTINAQPNEGLNRETVSKGFMFSPNVAAHYPDTKHLLKLVNDAYGRDAIELNQAFHKSFAKVRDASMRQLVLEQIVHYLTTYGAEALGVYNQASVFVPAEQLEVPEFTDVANLVVIRGLTKDELKAELMTLLGSGVALHEQTIADVLDVATFVGVDEADLEGIANREVRAALYDHLGLVPANPSEFLRFLIYRATGKTVVIKNQTLFEELKTRNNADLIRYFDQYERQEGLARLAEVFYRYKPLFLALRTNTRLRQTINKVRRLAIANHRPMPEDFLNSITARLGRGEVVDQDALATALAGATLFRKARLAYALKFRTGDPESILYRVRNGKSFATDFSFTNAEGAQAAYERVLESIAAGVRPLVEGKRIFIPAGLQYGLPATEKQFVGNLPAGTSVEIRDDLICGVHWANVDDHRIDLDLSLQNADGKLGWDGGYRDGRNGIYFSGDQTDAPGPSGASELFHIGSGAVGTWLMNLNYYNYGDSVPVPYEIFVGHEERRNITRAYTIDPNKIVVQASATANVKQATLGVVVATAEKTRFVFGGSALGSSITARVNAHAEQARRFLVSYYTEAISLNEILQLAGAEIVESIEDADLDLSPEAIDKTTIIKLLTSEEGGV